jgi:hypothetical protein
LDELPQDLPQEGEDREAAATIAEMATALADAATPGAEGAIVGVQADTASLAESKPDRRMRVGRLRPRLGRPRIARPRILARVRLPVRARIWLRRATVAALAPAIVLGLISATPAPTGPWPTPSSRPVAAAGTTASPRPSSGSRPSSSPGASSRPTNPSEAPSAAPSAGPVDTSSTARQSPLAAITFDNLMLDAGTGKSHVARTFTFTSNGQGPVDAAVVATSPTDATTLCMKADSNDYTCQSGATPELEMQAVWEHQYWSVTLISAGASTPTVDVAFSWPTDQPSIALTHGRLQGSPNPDPLRSLTATFQTRSAGFISLAAAWPPATADATLTVTDISSAKAIPVDTVTYSGAGAIQPGYKHSAAAAHTYRILLYNDGTDVAVTDLTATIAFP